MKNQRRLIFTSWFLLFLFFYSRLQQTPISAQEVEDEREFDYVQESEKGPHPWGELKKEWKACKHGKLQAPIDLLNQRVKIIPKLAELKINYKPADATLKNRVHDISLTKDVVSITDTKEEVHKGVIDPRELKIGGLKYYRYIGSLTIPPCTEGVIWTINKRLLVILRLTWNCPRISTVSREQVRLLREAVHDHAEMNARSLQPLNERDFHFPFSMFHLGDSKN